jgi:hypothetical protein
LQKALASPERATHEASWVDALSRKLKRLVGTDR